METKECKNKKCIYYIDYGQCSCNNDMHELGDCIYENGVINKQAPIQCTWAK